MKQQISSIDFVLFKNKQTTNERLLDKFLNIYLVERKISLITVGKGFIRRRYTVFSSEPNQSGQRKNSAYYFIDGSVARV